MKHSQKEEAIPLSKTAPLSKNKSTSLQTNEHQGQMKKPTNKKRTSKTSMQNEKQLNELVNEDQMNEPIQVNTKEVKTMGMSLSLSKSGAEYNVLIGQKVAKMIEARLSGALKEIETIEREITQLREEYKASHAMLNLPHKKRMELLHAKTGKYEEFDKLDPEEESKAQRKRNQNQKTIQQMASQLDQRFQQSQRNAASVTQTCWCCWERIDKNLVISLGEYAYLAIPKTGRMMPGHTLIIPMQHSPSIRLVSPEVVNEIRNFQKSLIRLWDEMDCDIVFMETAKDLGGRRHSYVECVPVPRSAAEELPIYFQKALMECESEWADNKKIHKTSKGIHSAIPDNFPYFHIEFGGSGGYAHVIEHPSSWPKHFGHSILGGILQLEPEIWINPPKTSQSVLMKQKQDFIQRWDRYDWTKALDG